MIDPLLKKPARGKLTKDLFSKFGLQSPALVILTEKQRGREDDFDRVPQEIYADAVHVEAIFSEEEAIIPQDWATEPETGRSLKPWGRIVNLEADEEFEIDRVTEGKAFSLAVWICQIIPADDRLYLEQ